MNYYIDTEFNGFCGRLISMAIVSQDLNHYFYEVLPEDTYIPQGGTLDPWVERNVIPILNQEPISVREFQHRLKLFLCEAQESSLYGDPIEIIADWPEDLMHFNKMLIIAPGRMIEVPEYKLHFDPTLPNTALPHMSSVPHNALEDARALARWSQKNYGD